MGILFKMIPAPYRWLAIMALALALVGFGWVQGADHVQRQWDSENQAEALAAAKTGQRQAGENIKVVTVYVDKIKVVHDKGATIKQEVVVYVPQAADADCTINAGFVRLHDAAAGNTIPGPSRVADAAPSGVALSTVAATLIDNYTACHENAEQLIAWQEWAKAMKAAEAQP